MCPSDSPCAERALRLRPHPRPPATTSTTTASFRIPPRGGGCAAMGWVYPCARLRTCSSISTTTSACSPVCNPASQQAGQSTRPRAGSHTRPAAPAATRPPAHLRVCSRSRLRNRWPASRLPARTSPTRLGSRLCAYKTGCPPAASIVPSPPTQLLAAAPACSACHPACYSPTDSSPCPPRWLPTCRQGSHAPPLSYKSTVVVYILCIYNPFNVFNVGIMQFSS